MPEILQELAEIKNDNGFVWTFKSCDFPDQDFETWRAQGNQIFFSQAYSGGRKIAKTLFSDMALDILAHFSVLASLAKDTILDSYTEPELKALKSAFETGRNGRWLFDNKAKQYSFFWYHSFSVYFEPAEEKFILSYDYDAGDTAYHEGLRRTATDKVAISLSDAVKMVRDPAYAEGFAFKYVKRSKVSKNDYYYPYQEQPSRPRSEMIQKRQDKYIILSEKLMTSIESFMKEDGKNIPLDYLHPIFAHIRSANSSRRIQTSIHGINALIKDFYYVADNIQDFHFTHTQVSSLTSALKTY